MPRMFHCVLQGDLDPSVLITHHLPLSDVARGYELFEGDEGWMRTGSLPAVTAPWHRNLLDFCFAGCIDRRLTGYVCGGSVRTVSENSVKVTTDSAASVPHEIHTFGSEGLP